MQSTSNGRRSSDAAAISDRGFSMVELLVVIGILGVLAAVAVFGVRGISDRGDDSACDADRRVLLTAVEAYFADVTATEIAPIGTGSERFERTLVDRGLISAISGRHAVNADGSVVVTSGAGC